jgi:hypothetical protein
MDSLHNNLINKIGKVDYGGCILKEYIRIGTVFNYSHCQETEATILNDLLGYHKLTTEI